MKRNVMQRAGFHFSLSPWPGRWSACLLLLVIGIQARSFARTITVTNTDDDGPGSLRYEVDFAFSGDTIEFSPEVRGAIVLTSGKLVLSKPLTIIGPGANQLAIDGNHHDTAVIVRLGAIIEASGLTIRNGARSGIINEGQLELRDMIVSGNSNEGRSGGGIENVRNLTLTYTVVAHNSAKQGGGIANGHSLRIDHSILTENTAYGGGALENTSTAEIVDSTLSGNTASSGGAIFDFASNSLVLTRTTVSGNSAVGGGAIYTDFGHVVLTNSTVAGNTSTDEGRFGAAIFNGNNSRIRLINSTVAGNGNSAFSSEVTLEGTLVANNGVNCKGDGQKSLGYNISDDNSCASFLTKAGDENNVGPGAGLDPKGLQDNGGPTQTIALLPDSPAVDHIPTRACTELDFRRLLVDQRGTSRPQGPACDTGAFELVPQE